MSVNYETTYPTVTNATCSSDSNCAVGSQCTSSSQCTTGNCCAYIANLGFNFTLFNTITFPGSIQTNDATGRMTALSKEAYNAFLTSYYYTVRNCLPSTEGATTTSYYDTFYDFGYVTTSADTSKFVGYMCAPRVDLNQAETVQAVVAAFIAAASLMYIA